MGHITKRVDLGGRRIIKRKDQGQLITDTAYIFFDKLVTKCIGIKAKDEGAYQYISMSSLLHND